MPLLIDGHNLIGKLPDLHLSDPRDEDKLISRLKQYVARTGRQVVVVFDPPKGGDPSSWFRDERYEYRNLSVIFASGGRTADDVIRERVAAARDKQGLIVVTSDAAVRGFAAQCGVRNQRTSDEFARELRDALNTPAPSEKPAVRNAEVDEWMKVFKEPEGASPPAPAPTPKLSPQEAKRLRRMEQLRRQSEAGKSRRLR